MTHKITVSVINTEVKRVITMRTADCVHSLMHFLHMVSPPSYLRACTVGSRADSVSRCDASDVPFVCPFVTDQPEDSDQTKLVVGVVVGLLVATVVIGLAYWVYMKKAK